MHRQASRDAYSLPLSPAELRGRSVCVDCRKPNQFQEFNHSPPLLLPRGYLVYFKRFSDDFLNPHPWIERRKGILKNDLKIFSMRPHSPPGKVGDSFSHKEYLT